MAVGGTWGKILHVDVTDGSSWIETPPDDLYLRLIGGRGFVAYLLLKYTPAGVDALGPENVLIFAPGVLQGSNLPSSGRHGVGAKSPLTGAIASSEAGGWWGHEFKRTGYDALVVHGRAASPVYLVMGRLCPLSRWCRSATPTTSVTDTTGSRWPGSWVRSTSRPTCRCGR